jgi:DNA-binding transcriptional ArsR family regulator
MHPVASWVQAQQILLDKKAVPLMVKWLSAGPEQEVATAAARALAKAAKGNRGIQAAICDAGVLACNASTTPLHAEYALCLSVFLQCSSTQLLMLSPQVVSVHLKEFVQLVCCQHHALLNARTRADGIPGFVSMLGGKPGSLAVRAAAEALSDLAKDNRSGQDGIRQAGAIAQLLNLLSSSMESSSLVVTVVKALSVLAHGNDANMEAIFHHGAIPLLLDMLHKRVGHICNAAASDLIRVLCSNSLCQQQILRNHGLQVLPSPPLSLHACCACASPTRVLLGLDTNSVSRDMGQTG